MAEFYTNIAGKSREIDPTAKEHSQKRKKWFKSFLNRLKEDQPDDFKSVKIKIVGSVDKEQATADSDIDIIIQSSSSNELIIPRIRGDLFKLLEEMNKNGEVTYKINIHDVGNPLLFSEVAKLKNRRIQ